MRSSLSRIIGVIALASTMLATQFVSGSTATPRSERDEAHAKHVLLLSVDGLHQSDLTWWVHKHPGSNLAKLVRGGVEYRNAATPVPSDSFPGMIAQVTGGNPATTGVFYDVSYNRRLLPPGTSCSPGQATGLGTSVIFDESLDRNPDSIDAGYGIPNLYPGLPTSVLALPGRVATIERTMLDAAKLPLRPESCRLVWPRRYLKVNTVFQVAKRAGLRTAWSDKHPAYEILAGHRGRAIDDLFTPEINGSSTDPNLPGGPGESWTDNNSKTQFYDTIKVQAVLNEIKGLDHSGEHRVGVPAIFGMNFQSVSTAEKLALSPLHGVERRGGYVLVHHRWTPGPVLRDALRFVDGRLGRMIDELKDRHMLGSTAIIVSAKHGQSPIQTTALKRIDDARVIDALNSAWRASGGESDLVAFSINDDSMYLWLTDRSPAALAFAREFLLSYDLPASAQAATNYSGDWIGFKSSGLRAVRNGPLFFGVSDESPRVPDLVGIVQHGVVYTGKTSKIAEHGGSDPQDRHVPIVVFGGEHRGSVGTSVETTQIAPSILKLLNLDPRSLKAVRAEHTAVLPRL